MSTWSGDRKATHLYIGVCRECDGVVVLLSDIPGDEKRTANEVARIVRDGLTLRHIPFTEYPPAERCMHREDCPRGARAKRAKRGAAA